MDVLVVFIGGVYMSSLSLFTPEVTSRFCWERIKNDEFRNEVLFFSSNFRFFDFVVFFEFDLFSCFKKTGQTVLCS